MPSRKKIIRMYVGDDEYALIFRVAKRAGLSLSTFAKRVCLGQEVKSLEYAHVRHDLRSLRGELGKIGGLFKQLLAQGILDKHRVFQHLAKIDELQKNINAAVERCS